MRKPGRIVQNKSYKLNIINNRMFLEINKTTFLIVLNLCVYREKQKWFNEEKL